MHPQREHCVGELPLIDYTGLTVPVINSASGEVCKAQTFVTVLGASSYSYAESSWTQSLPNWCTSASA